MEEASASRLVEPPGHCRSLWAEDDDYHERLDWTGEWRGRWEKRTALKTRDMPDGVCENRKHIVVGVDLAVRFVWLCCVGRHTG